MINYFGDFPVNAIVYIPFNTFDSNDPCASVTATNLINTDVHIHKDGGTTQRNNAAGITMTIDYDSITGNHLLIIDTSDNTVADFYQAGHEYQVRVEGVTVDAGTINAWVGCFSIERSGAALALIKNTDYGLAKLVRSTTPANTLTITSNKVDVNDKTGFSLAATGADLILKSSTFIQAIVAGISELATYGLTALNILLTSTGIKVATNGDKTGYALTSAYDAAKSAAAPGAKMDLIDAPNGTAVTAIQNGLSKPGTAQTITPPADMALNSTVMKAAGYSAPPSAAAIADAVLEESLADHKSVANSLAKALHETNQRLNGVKVVVDEDAGTIKIYDTNGTSLLFTLTKTAVGNIYTMART